MLNRKHNLKFIFLAWTLDTRTYATYLIYANFKDFGTSMKNADVILKMRNTNTSSLVNKMV